eukprot:119030-Amphidinium_carterae.1
MSGLFCVACVSGLREVLAKVCRLDGSARASSSNLRLKWQKRRAKGVLKCAEVMARRSWQATPEIPWPHLRGHTVALVFSAGL